VARAVVLKSDMVRIVVLQNVVGSAVVVRALLLQIVVARIVVPQNVVRSAVVARAVALKSVSVPVSIGGCGAAAQPLGFKCGVSDLHAFSRPSVMSTLFVCRNLIGIDYFPVVCLRK
jgi:hypothetical protein